MAMPNDDDMMRPLFSVNPTVSFVTLFAAAINAGVQAQKLGGSRISEAGFAGTRTEGPLSPARRARQPRRGMRFVVHKENNRRT
jgi:hypothetical protein